MTNEMRSKTLVMVSRLAFYPMHWAAARSIVQRFSVRLAVISDRPPALPSVHRSLGWVDPNLEPNDATSILQLPDGKILHRARWLYSLFRKLRPDAVWVQEEPTSDLTYATLGALSLSRRPRVGVALCENIFGRRDGLEGAARHLLWRRIDVLLATATASIEGIRAAGMPASVRGIPLVAGAMAPPAQVYPLDLPFRRGDGDFVVGFAGRICPEKGWRVLLDAIASLPANVKCALAGDGPEIEALRRRMQEPALAGRVAYVGLLPKDELWRFYAAVDCLVLPSLTRPNWKEQFGGVLADGMAMGLPLIGSDSGAIPEVIGPAGLVTPEGDSAALIQAIDRLHRDPELRARLGEAGRRRFATEFDIPAYAEKIAAALGLTAKD